MSIPHLFRSLVFQFPSSMRRAFRLLHSTYIHPYVESIKLTTTSKLDAMKSGSSLQVIILALPKMVHLQRLAIDVACPADLYVYIHDSKQIKQLVFTKLASKTNNLGRAQCRLEALELFDMGRKELIPTGLIMQSASTLKSLSVHSRGYIYAFWGFTQLPSHLLHILQYGPRHRATHLTRYPRIVPFYHRTPSPHFSTIRLLTSA